MLSIREKSFTRFLLFNLIMALVLIVGLMYITNKYFYSYEENIEKQIISDIAQIRNKEGVDIIGGTLYESDEEIQQVLNEVKSRTYLRFLSPSNYQISVLSTLVLVIFISYIFLFTINMLIISSHQRRYIKSVDNFIDSVIEQRFDIVLDESQEGITSKLNMRFNKMGNAINRNYNRVLEDNMNIKNTLADISHQIKTPLTSLSINNEILSESDELTEEQIEFIKINESQITRLVWLTDSLLKISKLDSNTVHFNKEEILALELVGDFKNILSRQLKAKDLKIQITGDFEMLINADYEWTKEALLNLVKNATEHAFTQTMITIDLVSNSSYKAIDVHNIGNNISLEKLTRIFERFYKSKDNTNPDSIGIGLNLSKKIIESQGGTIAVSNEENGVKFSILFLNI